MNKVTNTITMFAHSKSSPSRGNFTIYCCLFSKKRAGPKMKVGSTGLLKSREITNVLKNINTPKERSKSHSLYVHASIPRTHECLDMNKKRDPT